MNVHPIVRQIIDRDCHVSWTEREVIRHVISRLKGGMKAFRKMPADHRQGLVNQCRHRRRENIEDYTRVMSGRF